MDLWLQSEEQVIQCSYVCIASTLAKGAITNKEERAHYVISLTCLRVLPIGKNLTSNADVKVSELSQSICYQSDRQLENQIHGQGNYNFYLGEFTSTTTFGARLEFNLIPSNSNLQKELQQSEIKGNQILILGRNEEEYDQRDQVNKKFLNTTTNNKLRLLYQS